jgi:hypothetical protein
MFFGAVLLVVSVSNLWALGPADNAPSSTAQITLLQNGEFAVGEAKLKLADVPPKLKALRIPPTTMIRIAVPAGTSTNALKAIAGKLASSGYRMVLFTPPKRVEAYVGVPDAKGR